MEGDDLRPPAGVFALLVLLLFFFGAVPLPNPFKIRVSLR